MEANKKTEIQQFVRRVVYKNKTYKESNNLKIGAIRAQKIKVKVNVSVKTQKKLLGGIELKINKMLMTQQFKMKCKSRIQ